MSIEGKGEDRAGGEISPVENSTSNSGGTGMQAVGVKVNGAP